MMYRLSTPSTRYSILPCTKSSGKFMHIEECDRPASLIIVISLPIFFERYRTSRGYLVEDRILQASCAGRWPV